jgi:hypothetical protein
MFLKGTSPILIGFSSIIFFISIQRYFGIDNYVPSFRQADDNIRLKTFAVIIFQTDLNIIFPPFAKARIFQRPFKNNLAPGPPGFTVSL